MAYTLKATVQCVSEKSIYTFEKFYQTKILWSWDYIFVWIFDLGSDLYNDTTDMKNISRMSEHSRLLLAKYMKK